MKLKDYLKQLNFLAKTHPESLEMEVITSMDDEGNGFNNVYYAPSMGLFERGEFTGASQFKEEEITKKSNSVCLN